MASNKFRMRELVILIISLYFMEVIHIELSYKGWVIYVLEVFWEDFVNKLRLTLNYKRFTVMRPWNNVISWLFLEHSNDYHSFKFNYQKYLKMKEKISYIYNIVSFLKKWNYLRCLLILGPFWLSLFHQY